MSSSPLTYEASGYQANTGLSLGCFPRPLLLYIFQELEKNFKHLVRVQRIKIWNRIRATKLQLRSIDRFPRNQKSKTFELAGQHRNEFYRATNLQKSFLHLLTKQFTVVRIIGVNWTKLFLFINGDLIFRKWYCFFYRIIYCLVKNVYKM